MKPLLIIGSSGHAAAIIEAVKLAGRYRVVGLLDSFESIGTEKHGYQVCGAPEDAAQVAADLKCLNFFIAVGDNWSRQSIAEKLKVLVPEAEYVTLVHPQAIVSSSVALGPGTVVLEGAILQTDVMISEGCIVNAAAGLGHGCHIGPYASVSGGVRLAGACRVGNRSAVGLGACIVEKIAIGRDVVIAAGAVVFKDIPDEMVALGNPARLIRQRKPDESYLR